MAVSANRLELLQIADAVAREKVIDRQIVLAAMEDAIAKAARSRYGTETDVHARIDPRTGELNISRHLLIVEQIENPATEILLEDARKSGRTARRYHCRYAASVRFRPYCRTVRQAGHRAKSARSRA